MKHQGRHFTEGSIRASGIWLVGAKRSISGLLFKCVTCRRLHGKTEHQQMSDLTAERLQVAPPFSYVGVDVFGPWEVLSRRTRGGHANSQRWAVLFSCMCTRAVHIEIIETMSASSFINAMVFRYQRTCKATTLRLRHQLRGGLPRLGNGWVPL